MRIIKRHGIVFDSETQTGVVFHLMGALSEFGKLGVTCIGDTIEMAHQIYSKTVQALGEETGAPVEVE